MVNVDEPAPAEDVSLSCVLEEIKGELSKADKAFLVLVKESDSNKASTPAKNKTDKFNYINLGFTSEIYVVEIRSLPKHYGAPNLKKLSNEKSETEAQQDQVGQARLLLCLRLLPKRKGS